MHPTLTHPHLYMVDKTGKVYNAKEFYRCMTEVVSRAAGIPLKYFGLDK